MAAGIQIAAKRAVGFANDEHRLTTDMRGEEVAMLADMCLMAEEHPVGLEDVAVFGLENLGIVVDRPVDLEHAVLRPVVDETRIIAPVRTAATRRNLIHGQFTFTPAALPTSTHFLCCTAM